ncbi:hypothetical protein EYE40_07790 [Glaciihabitans arcticus]|uniref:DUF3887 domain-containing protein n=1 Tax=Glaciihabitans arcticus TaxID=2668039 RepID=A0A4Q9GQX4_9MICO|nr:hypothetical protein [Glaciihabitans arcticus]TBN57306.1 hypothetical protein EYE40_07790 [Glaciihabitans arcticus]
MRNTRIAATLLIAALALTGCAPSAEPEPINPDSSQPADDQPTGAPVASGLTDDDLANISAAISSDNTAALEPYLAESVLSTIASTEFSEQRTPAEAIKDLEYVVFVEDWTFPMDQGIVDSLTASAYSEYIVGTPYGGIGPKNEFIIFGAEDGKIVSIFQGFDVTLLVE